MLGKGFILEPEKAHELIEQDPRNKDVLFPYLNGEDLNSRPDCSASRWVINFHDWPEEQARGYPEVFDIVERLVKPVRLKVTHSKNAREKWWQFERRRPELYSIISKLDRVLVVALVSRMALPVSVPTGQVFSHMLGVFSEEGDAGLALLSSNIHFSWVLSRASTLETRIRYTPSDVYETFPQPSSRRMESLADLGSLLNETRSAIMLERKIGLTSLYNKFHNPTVSDADIRELRNIHIRIDQAVLLAYGWNDLNLEWKFQSDQQGVRYTLLQGMRVEIIDRLLELNHELARG